MTKPVAVSRLRELLASLQTSTTRVVQLYGANTDVGKTLVSVGLVREALRRGGGGGSGGGGGTVYLKPMQTVRTSTVVGSFVRSFGDARARLRSLLV